MDIQAEKLYLIEQLARLQDAGMIKQVKELLQGSLKDKALGTAPNSQIITRSDLVARAESSERAIEQGDVTSIEAFEEESKTW